ncbi:MAG: choice-of-anchor X domain-containing protein, partial [Candidatus Hinthialibacter sp.]
DLLILAFGFNDSYEFRFSEEEFYEKLKQRNLTEGLNGLPLFLYDHSDFCHWLIRRIKSLSKHAIEQELMQRAARREWHARVDQDSYRANLQMMIEDIRSQGGDAVVLNLDLPNTWVREPLQRLQEELNAAYLDVQSLFLSQSQTDSRTETLQRTLRKPGTDPLAGLPKTALLFRVWIPEEITIPAVPFLLLNSSAHPFPWQIRLFDNGTHGDEQAGDRVWSGRIEWESQEIVDYCFLPERLPDEQPLYENSVKALRYYHHADFRDIRPGAEWISPIHAINRIPIEHLMIPGDVIHPNAQGHQIIAENLAPIVQKILSK